MAHGSRPARPTRSDSLKRTGGPLVTALVLLVAGALAAWPRAAGAHVGGGAFILLLPTHLYVTGGAIVVAASFVLVALAPPRLFSRLETCSRRWRRPMRPWREVTSTGASLLSLGGILFLIAAGELGSRDPLSNPLPLFVWTVWWVGFTYLHAVLGQSLGPPEPVDRALSRADHGRAPSTPARTPAAPVPVVGRALARGGGLPRVRLARARLPGAR